MFFVHIDNEHLERVQATKFIGIHIDEHFTSEYHINHCKKGICAIIMSKQAFPEYIRHVFTSRVVVMLNSVHKQFKCKQDTPHERTVDYAMIHIVLKDGISRLASAQCSRNPKSSAFLFTAGSAGTPMTARNYPTTTTTTTTMAPI